MAKKIIHNSTVKGKSASTSQYTKTKIGYGKPKKIVMNAKGKPLKGTYGKIKIA